jgi:hypothetical protein
LDRGIAYVVIAMRDGRVIELKGCADRAAAMTYAQTGASCFRRTSVGSVQT